MIIDECKKKMQLTLENYKQELLGLRAGHVQPEMLENLMVSAYGGKGHLKDFASVGVIDYRSLSITVWDAELLDSVKKTIMESELGVNPRSEGQTLRLYFPELTMERRKDLVKILHRFKEDTKVAVRHERRWGLDQVKQQGKDKGLSKDEAKQLSDSIQKLTDQFIKNIDDLSKLKEQEILMV